METDDLFDEVHDSENIPVHAWQIEEVERRAEKLREYPETALAWEEVRLRVRNRNNSKFIR